MKKVTKTQLDRVVAAITKRHPELAELDGSNGLFIADHTHEELSPGAYSISWEMGPEDWAIEAAWELRDVDPDLFIEPIYSFALGIYPQS